MSRTVFQFKTDLKKFSERVKLDYDQVVRKVTLDLFGRIVTLTPVDTGRARAGWGVSRGTIPSDVPPAIPAGAGQSEQQATQAAFANVRMESANPFTSLFIFNNVEYIEALENGHSQKAPAGMVSIAMAAVETGLELGTG
jgi:hypothetical protein